MAIRRLTEISGNDQSEKKKSKRFRIADFIQNFRKLSQQSRLNRKLHSEETIHGYNPHADKLFSDFLIIPEVPKNEVDIRVLNSEAVQLFTLLSSGALDNEPDLEKQITLAEQFLSRVNAKNREERMSRLQKRGVDPITLGMEIKFGKKTPTTLGSALTRLSSVYKEDLNQQRNIERQTEPTASARTFLREVLASMKLGWEPKQWVIHETASVLLDEQHTEIMDITAIQVAAGLLFPDSTPIRKKERFPKSDRETQLYFPFHKARSKNQFIDEMKPYVHDDADYTELRSLINHKPIEYSRLVRQVTFFYLGCFGIQAYQKELRRRTDLEDKLSDSFQELLTAWNELLQSAGIHNPTNNERFIYYDQDQETYPEKIPYNTLINELSAHHDFVFPDGQTLREKTRELIRTYNKQVRAVIHY